MGDKEAGRPVGLARKHRKQGAVVEQAGGRRDTTHSLGASLAQRSFPKWCFCSRSYRGRHGKTMASEGRYLRRLWFGN